MLFPYATKQMSSLFGERNLTAIARRVTKQLKRGFAQAHFYVVGHHLPQNNPMPVTEVDLEIKQITIKDSDDIDEITKIDEWQIPKADTLKMLEEGQLCYLAKHQNHIVACQWVILTKVFKEYYLHRELRLAPNEAYYWRGFTIPAFRGKGVLPLLQRQVDVDVHRRFGITFRSGWIRTNNKPMLRALSKLGGVQVGRMGFFQVLNVRFHYLWGSRAFRNTKPRFKIQILW